MNYCYTYYSFGGTYIPSLFFLKMARLSVASLRSVKHEFDTITLYVDKYSLQYFEKMPFDNIQLIDYSEKEYGKIDKRYWNFAKIMTYAKQDAAFLHVDFDTMFMPGFEVPVGVDIVTEKLRDYECDFRIRRHSWKDGIQPQKLICSGLIGGNGRGMVGAFLTNQTHAICGCQNAWFIGDKERISIEEYSFTQLVESEKLTVAELDQRFFAHWQGSDKEEQYGAIINKLYNQFF